MAGDKAIQNNINYEFAGMRKLVQEKENELRKAADEVELRNLAKN